LYDIVSLRVRYTERGLVRGDGMRTRRTADKTSTSAGNACGNQCYFSYGFLVLVVVRL